MQRSPRVLPVLPNWNPGVAATGTASALAFLSREAQTTPGTHQTQQWAARCNTKPFPGVHEARKLAFRAWFLLPAPKTVPGTQQSCDFC